MADSEKMRLRGKVTKGLIGMGALGAFLLIVGIIVGITSAVYTSCGIGGVLVGILLVSSTILNMVSTNRKGESKAYGRKGY